MCVLYKKRWSYIKRSELVGEGLGKMVDPEVLAFRGKRLVLYWTVGFFFFITWVVYTGKKNPPVFSNDHHAPIGMCFYGELYKAQLIRRSEVRLRDEEGD